METLFRSFRTQLEHTSTEVVRFLHDQIAWDSRLVAILGARGVGKTTLLLQHIKLYDREDESLYVTADDFYFTKYRLFDMAYQYYNLGAVIGIMTFIFLAIGSLLVYRRTKAYKDEEGFQ